MTPAELKLLENLSTRIDNLTQEHCSATLKVSGVLKGLLDEAKEMHKTGRDLALTASMLSTRHEELSDRVLCLEETGEPL